MSKFFFGLNTLLVPELCQLYFLVPEFQFASQMIPQFLKKSPDWHLNKVFHPKTNGLPRHCYLAPLGTQHLFLATCQHPYNCQITQILAHHILTSFTDFGGK
jgi:hypothetical protein